MSVPDASTPSLWLSSPVKTTATKGPFTLNFQFPAGEYRPAMQDEANVYYRPPTPALLSGNTQDELYVVVPKDGTPLHFWIRGYPYRYRPAEPFSFDE